MTDPSGVCAKRAEVLAPGVSYVRGWSEGKRGADALAEQLRTAGLADEFAGLRADVNVIGQGVVNLGAVRPEVALRLVGLLGAGLVMEMLVQWASEDQSDPARENPAAG
ncbi:hypothetical protein [Actinacidiphila sp. ITFR-21]|uniref:hypothetical protein n=1 Tax=Actinacidiphila sp. ITFR-21 TaxID=3075199 RepID=UPI002888FDE8|nr:hypothetical protein [Streptomyces sp. ITFR-21]WNI18075.1 hypothetical protein RLT57_22700 [Streptomyces sp. ITFR-21]